MNAPVDILALLSQDENLDAKFKAAIKPTTLEGRIAYKREQAREDARGEDLWLARGGSGE